MLFLLFNMSRPNIGKSTVHRLLQIASGGSPVAAKAAEEAQAAVERYLEKAGQAAKDRLDIARRKTVTREIAEAVLTNSCAGIMANSFRYVKGNVRGLPVAGVLRVFSHEGKSGRKALGLGFNISEDAKKMIAGAAEAFIEQLGKRARQVSQEFDKNRLTIKDRDVRVAIMGMGV